MKEEPQGLRIDINNIIDDIQNIKKDEIDFAYIYL